MKALLLAAAILVSQDGGSLEAIVNRHKEAVRKAKTFDDGISAARATLAEIEKFLETARDGEPAARARFIAADLSARLDDFAGAAAHARKFLETWPKHAQAALVRMELAHALVADGREGEAREVYESLIKEHADDPRVLEARLRIAQSYVTEKRDDEAIRAFARVRADFKGKPEEWVAALQQAIACLIAGRAGEGRGLLEEAIRSCPDLQTVKYAERILTNWLWIGKPAPSLEGKDLKGEPVRAEFLKERVTVLYFLSSSFEFFDTESAVMRRIVRRFGDKNVSVLAVAIDRDKAKLETDLARAGVTWPVLFDGNGFDGPAAGAFQVRALPMVLVIDRKGAIRFVNPLFSRHGRELNRCVESLVAEK
jgi:tetratricopeptide (TPR) repeat protein